MGIVFSACLSAPARKSCFKEFTSTVPLCVYFHAHARHPRHPNIFRMGEINLDTKPRNAGHYIFLKPGVSLYVTSFLYAGTIDHANYHANVEFSRKLTSDDIVSYSFVPHPDREDCAIPTESILNFIINQFSRHLSISWRLVGSDERCNYFTIKTLSILLILRVLLSTILAIIFGIVHSVLTFWTLGFINILPLLFLELWDGPYKNKKVQKLHVDQEQTVIPDQEQTVILDLEQTVIPDLEQTVIPDLKQTVSPEQSLKSVQF